MNITVKAPPGGEYNVDIQGVKWEYNWWRWSTIAFSFALVCVTVFWMILTDEHFPTPDFISFLKNAFYNVFLRWQGWVFLLGAFLAIVWTEYTLNKKVHFECPFPECGVEIIVSEPWECPQCRDDKITTPKNAFHTFFDKCKHGHKPTSYQCPTCVKEGRQGVFELIPGGRKDKFAKLAIIQQPNPPQNPPQLPASQQEYIPRDRFF